MKTNELIGPALDCAVAQCEGKDFFVEKGVIYSFLQGCNLPHVPYYDREIYRPSTNWSQGGSIIERECIGSLHEGKNVWSASNKWDDPAKIFYGKTKLVAAMRCYVASKLGEEVEVPDELL